MEQNILVLITLTVFILASLRKILLHVYWWQTKEYRLDRMFVFWKTREGRAIFFPETFWLKILVSIFALVNPPVLFIAFFIWMLEGVQAVYELILHKLRKPVFTLRAWEIVTTGIFIAAMGIVLVFLFRSAEVGLYVLLIADLFLWLGAPLGILWTTPFVFLTKVRLVNRAKSRLQKVRPTVIGITGSFGKTSTKEFTATVLAEKFKVAKNYKSENTEFGVAQNVIRNVKENIDVFVAEMGAYKIGEIEKLCNILKPQIGVITAISNQHLALFGSLENIKKAKRELIDSLPEDGIAIFNGDDKTCLKLALEEKRRTIVYKTHESQNYNLKFQSSKLIGKMLISGDDIRVERDGIQFTLHIGKQKAQIRVSLLGVHFVQNLLAASAVGHALGMNITQIKKGLQKIKPVARTMELKSGPGGSLVIDDSYSASYGGFKAALSWLKTVRASRKFVVTPGIIELGNESDKIHEELGKQMSEIVTTVFVTNKEFYPKFLKGMGEEKDKLLVAGENDLSRFRQQLKKDDILLIEGRIPDHLKKKII